MSSKVAIENPWMPFYLTCVNGISDPLALSINDIISCDESNPIEHICIFNFMVDPIWLMDACPLLRRIPLLLIHGDKSLQSNDLLYPNIVSSLVDLGPETYGSHHTKMFLIFYKSGFRIAIGTSNLLEADWTSKSQGFYVQDFPLKNATSIPTSTGYSYVDDLKSYLNETNLFSFVARKLLQDKVINQLAKYDFSSAEVVLLASAPGRFKVNKSPSGSPVCNWGHLKLREYLNQYKQAKRENSSSPSSPSSLTADKYWSESATAMQCSAVSSLGKIKTTAQMTAIPLLLYHDVLWGAVDSQFWGARLLEVAAVLTVWSMFYYLRLAWPLIKEKSGQL